MNKRIDPNLRIIGEGLAEMRREKELTRAAVGKYLGWASGQFIFNFEAGVSMVPLKYIKRLARLYNVTDLSIRKTYFNYELLNLEKKYGIKVDERN